MIRLLIAEDDFSLRSFLSETLQIIGGDEFDIATVKNGNEAVEYLLQNEVDVLITDIRMYPSKTGGIDAITLIRQFSQLPIIVLSAYDDKKTREASYKAGANVFIKKPPHFHRLAVTVKRCAKQYRDTKPLIDPEQELKEKHRRLQLLKIQAARHGNDTPPHIITEIEDIETDIYG